MKNILSTQLKVLLINLLFLSSGILPLVAAEGQPNLPVKQSNRCNPKDLYALFCNPDNHCRPYVRWWWNGSRITEEEIIRQLDIMKAAGIGGVEINTIKFPGDADSLGFKSHPLFSDEWIRMVNVAADACRERGMVCDMILGSGWPYGGEFLTPDEQIQMLTVETFDVKGRSTFQIDKDSILEKVNPPIMSRGEAPIKELLYLRLMPKSVDRFTEGIYYDTQVDNDIISIDVPEGEYVLYCFVKLTGYMHVIEGVEGASGPVLNHFNRLAVEKYLNRFSDYLNFVHGNLKGKIRSTFTDSFELEGANWSSGMLEEFEKRKGYSLVPYLPYIIAKVGHMGNPVEEKYGSDFSQEVEEEIIERVRNDFEHVKVEVFHENFVNAYNDWCHKNGLKSRVQAYGRDLHPLETAMYIDVPECETWLWENLGAEFNERSFLSGRPYSMVNKFVSSGSLLSGNNLVSCEEVTNVLNIFHASLEDIKIAGDLSNLSGVNHSILHGFNYSPKESSFPGWIKFGTYFSERNTWWPYVRYWMDYKARLSAVFQNSEQQSDVAILAPLEDLWSKYGQQRDPFPVIVYPDYIHNLWEALHQNGNGCDYVSERIIRQAKLKNGRLVFGSRSYKVILLPNVSSLEPETAQRLLDFVSKNGTLVCIGETPGQSSGLKEAEERGQKVKKIIARIKDLYPDRFIEVPAPGYDEPICEWYGKIQKTCAITPYVEIDTPCKYFSQNYYKAGDKDIFFLINYDIKNGAEHIIRFPEAVKGKQPWIWNAETGERFMLPEKRNIQNLHFGPGEAKLIVFDPEKGGRYLPAVHTSDSVKVIDTVWNLKAAHMNGEIHNFEIDRLVDLNTLPMPWLRHFAGVLEYSTEIDVENPSGPGILDAGLTYNGVTELIVNGEPAGVKWYGERKFDIRNRLKKGTNAITVKVTTLLGNYTKSLKDNPTAQRWAYVRDYRPLGLAGPVKIY